METTVLHVEIIGPRKLTPEEVADILRQALGNKADVLVGYEKKEPANVNQN
jgi:hypothetical protein